MPKRRARALATAPYPRLTNIKGDPAWETKPPADRIECLLGMSLDRVYEILSVPFSEARNDVHTLSAQMQAVRVVILVSAKFSIEHGRQAERAQTLEALEQALAAPSRGYTPASDLAAPADSG